MNDRHFSDDDLNEWQTKMLPKWDSMPGELLRARAVVAAARLVVDSGGDSIGPLAQTIETYDLFRNA